jgi:hypothetical protein
MTSNDSKVEKVLTHFQTLSSVASSLNQASDELTKIVTILDEALKNLNVGLTVWVTFRSRAVEPEPDAYDDDQIGYGKVNGKWGIALRHIWGNYGWDAHDIEGPWLFNEAPREMRLHGVDKIPEVIAALGKEAFDITKKIHEKTQEVRKLANAIEKIASEQASSSKGRK